MIKFEGGFVGDVDFDLRDRFSVDIVGFCFFEKAPNQPVEIIVETYSGEIISRGVTGVERQDVADSFESRPYRSGFLIKVPRLIIPSAFRVRAQFEGKSF